MHLASKNLHLNDTNMLPNRHRPSLGCVSRKHLFKDGTDYVAKTWDASRGDDVKNSEWIPIPQTMMLNLDEKPFTSIGHHGNSSALNVSGLIRIAPSS